LSAASNSQFVASLRLFVDIARLRRGPEDVPVSTSLLVKTVLAGVLLSLGLGWILQQESGPLVGPLLTDTLLTLLSLAAFLRLARKPERFLQTATATFGFHLVVLPVLVLLEALMGRYVDMPSWQLPWVLMFVALAGWTLVVNARILQSATGWPVMVCIALVLLQDLAILGVVIGLFPDFVNTSAAAPTSPMV
jgi:hypothetical protein